MVPFLWVDVVVLAGCSVLAVLDVEAEWGRIRLGRPVYGLFVLAGLGAVYTIVVREGSVPPPGWGVMAFAVAYLPFLSTAFIDLPTTDRLAVEELEEILLGLGFRELRTTTGSEVVRRNGRRLRVEWEGTAQGDAVLVRLTVHPSLLPVTVSRPHVARIEGEEHLGRIRAEIRARRGSPPAPGGSWG